MDEFWNIWILEAEMIFLVANSCRITENVEWQVTKYLLFKEPQRSHLLTRYGQDLECNEEFRA